MTFISAKFRIIKKKIKSQKIRNICQERSYLNFAQLKEGWRLKGLF